MNPEYIAKLWKNFTKYGSISGHNITVSSNVPDSLDYSQSDGNRSTEASAEVVGLRTINTKQL
jgi:hypothetical protein